MKGKKVTGLVCLIIVLIMGMVISQGTSFIKPLPSNLVGYVKESSSNTPIYDAVVHLSVYDFRTGWIDMGYTNTDSAGKYNYSNVPIGARQIEICATNYNSYDGVFQEVIYLSPLTYNYVFYGHIRDAKTSQELSNAEVQITCKSEVITDTTDNSGYYCIKFSYETSGVRTFTLVASRMGYSTKTNIITRNYGYESQHYYLGVSWALIVAGGTAERFTRDAYGMYITLIDFYGFTADRIYLITPLDSIDGHSVPRDEFTSRANVEWGINQIDNGADSNDQVLIWWTGHGGIDYFNTDDDTITSVQLEDYLDDITCDRMVIVLGPCHSGSFVDNLNRTSNRVIYTSCTESQLGCITEYGKHSLFPWASYKALDPYLNASDADVNGDNSVSLLEMFNYCVIFVEEYIANVILGGYTYKEIHQDPVRWPNTGTADDFYFCGDKIY